MDFSKDYWGQMHIYLRQTIPYKDNSSYANLEADYSENYYMNDCGGFDAFQKTNGRQIDPRLLAISALICPTKHDRILDVGCGRGELTYYIARQGAFSVGVDYSADSIRIANNTYGEGDKHLQFVQADIVKAENLGQFDKIIMADVVEHIEQDFLEQIFMKLSDSLSEEGRLIVHTAPNRDYYEEYYPKIREEAIQKSFYLPQNPRSYYEQLMHINEQTPSKLMQALSLFFPAVKIWTGNVFEMNTVKSTEEQKRDVEIFAIACKSQNALSTAMQEICKQPKQEDVDVRITASDLLIDEETTSIQVPVEIENKGNVNITSGSFYPFFLSYHIYDKNGNKVLHDGNRAAIDLYPGKRAKVNILLTGLDCIRGGRQGIIRFALVAEQCFWAEDQMYNIKDINVTIKN